MKDDQYLVTGSGDKEIDVWKLSMRDPDEENKKPIESLTTSLELATLEDINDPTVITLLYLLVCFIQNILF